MVAVPITTGRTPAELRALARRERDGRVSARLLALANALDGMSRDQAARAAGMDRQTLRDWDHRYKAKGVEGLRDRPWPGRPCALDEGREAALKGLIRTRPVSLSITHILCSWRELGSGPYPAERGRSRIRWHLGGSWRCRWPATRMPGSTTRSRDAGSPTSGWADGCAPCSARWRAR